MNPTVSQAPWWYVAALAGGFTILGGLITQAGGWLSDRRRIRHEAATMDFERRRAYAVQLSAAAAEFMLQSKMYLQDYLSNFKFDPEQGDLAYRVGGKQPDIGPAYTAYWQLIFIAPRPVSDAARSVFEHARRLPSLANPSQQPKPWSRAAHDQSKALNQRNRSELVAAITKALDSTGAQPAGVHHLAEHERSA